MTASVVIVGAGVVGASVAYHLAALGRRDVLLLDAADGPARGSTGAATGGFRAQFSTDVGVRLSLLAREALLRFRDETGVDPGYVPAGYLWLALSEAELQTLRAALEIQRAAGLGEAAEVAPDDIARLNPRVRLDDVLGGTFCPTDGFLRPRALLEGYLAAAERLGVRVRWGAAVTRIDRDAGGRIIAVRAKDERIATRTVVNAGGPWAAGVARLAGVALPVAPLRRQVASTAAFDGLPATMPMTIFAGDAFHLRVREGRVLLLRPSPGVPGRPFDCSVDPAWVAEVTAVARRRVPVLRKTAVDPAACWAGLYEMSPDRHAILGPAAECPDLLLVNGSSGHGVMHAPALGRLAAEILLDGAASALDTTPLRPSRFDEGSPNRGGEIL